MITYEESFTLPENQFEEVLRGQPRVMPPPKRGHDRLLRRLEALLVAQLSSKFEVIGPSVGLGIIREAPFTYRIPDKMIFHAGVDLRMDNDIYIWETPLLIAECLSPANRKGPVKMLIEDYNAIRAPYIWLLEPEKRTCEVHYNGSLEMTLSDEDATVVFENAIIPLATLWTAFDRPADE